MVTLAKLQHALTTLEGNFGLFSLMPLYSSSLLRAMKGGAPNIMLYRRMPKAHLYRRLYRRMTCTKKGRSIR